MLKIGKILDDEGKEIFIVYNDITKATVAKFYTYSEASNYITH